MPWSRNWLAGSPPLNDLLALLRRCGPKDCDWQGLVDSIAQAARDGASVSALAERLGLDKGVTGYIYHTVPVVVYAWFQQGGDFRATLTAVLDCGGDTDTVGAIVGALAGALGGEDDIPADWRAGVVDWPRSLPLLRTLADRLATVTAIDRPAAPVRYFWPAIPLRNLLFLLIVLLHGFRRLLPPY